MPPQNELVLVDTNVFLAKWLDTDVIYQRLCSEAFFESAKICHYRIGFSKITVVEIIEKYPYLEASFNELAQDLLKQNKLCKFEEEIKDSEIIQTKKEAFSKGFEISKKDAFLATLANKRKMCLVSFDQNLIDYCREKNWKADYPTNLINLEKE